jgi:hypothetical protein
MKSRKILGGEATMKMSLRIFTVLSVVASSILFVPSASALHPSAPTSVTATSTGATTANVSFGTAFSLFGVFFIRQLHRQVVSLARCRSHLGAR